MLDCVRTSDTNTRTYVKMINQAWSVLSKGSAYADPTSSRKVDASAYTDSSAAAVRMLDILCPFSDDLLRSHRAEGILELVRRSPFADRLQAIDPVNTYDKATLTFPSSDLSIEITAQPTDLRIFLFSDDEVFLDEGRASVSMSCSIDTTTNTVSSEWTSGSYTVTGNLSSYVTIYPGVRVRMQSDFASASPYEFTVSKTVLPKTDYADLLSKAAAIPAAWSDPDLEDTWKSDPLWSNKLAAFAISAVELCHNASSA